MFEKPSSRAAARVRMDHQVLDYARPTTRRRAGRPFVTVPGRVSRPAGVVSILLALAAIPFFPPHMIVRSYNPQWHQWVAPMLVCGSLALAIVAGQADGSRWRAGVRDGLAGLVLAVGCLGYMIAGPRLIVCGERADRVKCASNLKQLALGMLLYGQRHGGQLPPDLPTLYLAEDLTAEQFVCPVSGDEIANGMKTPAVAGKLSDKPHCSYIYVGAGQTISAPSHTVLAYEPASNHSGDGANVLFGDGHVEFLGAKQLPAALAPTTTPATAPTTAPTSPPRAGR
jgi:prepilin-type processing-associated H-X9-DG protein